MDGERAPRDLRPIFHFGATDDRSTGAQLRFRCAIDSPVLRPCAHIYRPQSVLAFGAHVLRVEALDRAGNASRVTAFGFNVVGRWDAAADFAQPPRPENPGRDRYGNTSWFYLYSGTIAHDPSDYHPLPIFLVTDPHCENWRSMASPEGGTMVGYCNGRMAMGPGHYNLGQNAVLGWRSPVTMTIRVLATIWQSQTPCGVPQDGINWSVDHDATTLRSGYLAPGASATPELTVPIAAGESLYVVVNGVADTNCDWTTVDFSIETETP